MLGLVTNYGINNLHRPWRGRFRGWDREVRVDGGGGGGGGGGGQ